MRLLLIEDNAELCGLTVQGLERAGFAADTAHKVSTAKEALANGKYDAIILDLGLPDGSGEVILRDLRARGDSTPILILTARGGIHDRVLGLERGADDYLVKPFALEELVARIRALLRRPGQYVGRPITAGNVAFDTVGRQLFVDDRPCLLSARETALFELLIRRFGRVVPKDTVESLLFGPSDEVKSNAIEVYVHRLRKQLTELGAAVEVHTVRGIGYLMTETKRT